MTCVVLAAGYGTNLYPLTENFPKPLLEFNGKTILDWLLDDIDNSEAINRYAVISNHFFVERFEEWAAEKQLSAPIDILDDGTETNDTRLGAVIDIQFAIEELRLSDDLLVIAGDNLPEFSICGFIDYFYSKRHTCVMRCFEDDFKALTRSCVVDFTQDDRVLSIENPSENPKTNWSVPPMYIYAKNDIRLVEKSITSGENTDAPESFIKWLCKRTPVYAMKMHGKTYDIGDINSYSHAQKCYNGVK